MVTFFDSHLLISVCWLSVSPMFLASIALFVCSMFAATSGIFIHYPEGHVYSSYKLAKNVYRRACHSAMNNVISQPFKHLDNYYGSRKMNTFWNLVRRSKGTTSTTTDNISVCTLHDYYTDKFSQSTNCNTSIQQAESEVNTSYKHHENNVYKDSHMNEDIFVNYVSELRLGCAAG